ncbi:uracil-DNA glycosylase family protein [Streptococcus porci]|uniref:uracil-DNA glycosylase family protein n=1 Tax=Streptococcus porci TaxID=502567 RepID=UPI0003FF0E20|nr:uracil-DNA glycosylase family protein [Streptococcus porci]
MKTLDEIISAIMADSENVGFTQVGIKPLVAAPETARIVIIGQAPGVRAQETGIYFNDPSGDNLREWLGINRETFYHSGLIAVVPMDFYYPGKARNGDLPPRAGFAQKWHPDILRLMPKTELFILIGAYAQHFYLKQKSSVKVTDNVKHFRDFLPDYFPLVHPSPRNNIWQAKNPWFKEEILPELRKRVSEILSQI